MGPRHSRDEALASVVAAIRTDGLTKHRHYSYRDGSASFADQKGLRPGHSVAGILGCVVSRFDWGYEFLLAT